VQYSAVVWRNGELDANIRQSPSPATDGMGTAQYGLDFTGPNNSITANLDFTAHGWTSTTGGVSADRTEGRVTPSLRISAQRRYLVAAQRRGAPDWSAQWPRRFRVLSSEQECRA
jgi:hypothetical protein